jgi:hypothetical protein
MADHQGFTVQKPLGFSSRDVADFTFGRHHDTMALGQRKGWNIGEVWSLRRSFGGSIGVKIVGHGR